MFNFKLGSYVTDAATGFEGVIDGRAVWNTGNVQYSVRPKMSEDGTLTDSQWVDGDHLQLSDGDKGVDSKYGAPEFKFDNGDQVKSTIFKFKGTIIGQIQWLNGCLEYSICSKELDKEQRGIFKTISEMEIKLIKPKAVKTPKRRTGGPMKSSMNTRAESRA